LTTNETIKNGTKTNATSGNITTMGKNSTSKAKNKTIKVKNVTKRSLYWTIGEIRIYDPNQAFQERDL